MTTRNIIAAIVGLAVFSFSVTVETRAWGDLWFPLWCMAVAGVIATNIALMKARETPFTKWHHWMIGLALACVPVTPVQVVGLLVIADDLWQHVRQLRDPLFLSPLHLAYVRVFRWLRRPR